MLNNRRGWANFYEAHFRRRVGVSHLIRIRDRRQKVDQVRKLIRREVKDGDGEGVGTRAHAAAAVGIRGEIT